MERLRENIAAICDQVISVFIQDNGSANVEAITELTASFPSITLHKNSTNLGVSAALNQVMTWAHTNGTEWVLLLDQDSVCPGLFLDVLSANLPSDAAI